MRPAIRYVPTLPAPYEVPPYHNLGVLRPPRPTVSLDPRPVLIPILSSVICFPIVAFAIICLLRYRALRLRRKEHMRRLRGGGMRSARLEIPGREKPSLFSRDSSSGDTASRPPGHEEESGHRARLASSSSDEDEEFTSEVLARRGNNNHVKFGAAAAILHVPGIPSSRSGSPRSGSLRSGSPRGAGSPRSASVSFLDVVGVVGDDSEDDADDEDDIEPADAR